MSQLAPYNLRKKGTKNYKNINDGGETRNLEGDTVNNSPGAKSELVKYDRPNDVENISGLPLKSREVR